VAPVEGETPEPEEEEKPAAPEQRGSIFGSMFGSALSGEEQKKTE